MPRRGGLSSVRFIGRAEPIELYDDVLTDVGLGHGQLLRIVGEAGVGKSRGAGGVPVMLAACLRVMPWAWFNGDDHDVRMLIDVRGGWTACRTWLMAPLRGWVITLR